MELSKILIKNYLPYAKAVIVSRAIPGIDGFKPVQRRIIYTMHNLGLLKGDKVKSQNIVGATMRLHPNGDSSIYDAMVMMATGREGYNVPFIESKGNFGKAFSSSLQKAAPRYTEAKLAPICKEILDGINEDAVDFVPNFDNTLKEPSLFPTKFPNIIVNNSSGVAVGTSSCIPSFSINNACRATIGILKGEITTTEQLTEVLGSPEFTSGGFLHASKESLAKLVETGRGSFTITGTVEVYNDRLVITEIPYTTTVEDIMDAIEEALKEKKIKGIKDVKDEIGLEGLKLVVEIKNGYNSRDVLTELYRMTPLMSTISYRTRVIINNRCCELGIGELIKSWIEFRRGCIKRIYSFRLVKQKESEHMLSLWQKIIHDIPGVVAMIAKNTTDVAKSNLISTYGLDEEQAEYLLDLKIRSITTDRANDSIDKLNKVREDIKYSESVISDDSVTDAIIISDLTDIINNYGRENRTKLAAEIKKDSLKTEVKISDEVVTVVLTKGGYLRRLTSLRDIAGTFVAKNGDEEIKRWNIKNNEHLLVFDRFGTVHKVLVDSIDSSNRATLTDKLNEIAGIEKLQDIVWVDSCGDYSGYFNLIFPNGRGTRVLYDRAMGNRTKYKGLYSEVAPGQFWVTQEDKFFMITHRNKAAYCDISKLGMLSSRVAFKVARVSSGDYFVRLQPAKDVPNIGFIDISRYNKDYTVSIKDDVLWVDKEALAREEQRIKDELAKYKGNSNKENEDSDNNT